MISQRSDDNSGWIASISLATPAIKGKILMLGDEIQLICMTESSD